MSEPRPLTVHDVAIRTAAIAFGPRVIFEEPWADDPDFNDLRASRIRRAGDALHEGGLYLVTTELRLLAEELDERAALSYEFPEGGKEWTHVAATLRRRANELLTSTRPDHRGGT